MHKRALEAMEQHLRQPLERALELYEKNGGTEKACTKPDKIAKAAAESRVSHLFVSDALSGEDWSSNVALQTLAFGGQLFVTKPGRVPGAAGIAALLRF